MLQHAINGFCMALADSVPGVSGGTVAFIMGFYDDFIGSINNVVFGGLRRKVQGILYLLRLGIGWIIGMSLAVLVLNMLFEQHIHVVSSVFIGFIIGAVPIVCMDEPEATRKWKKGVPFLLLGGIIVIAVSVVNQNVTTAAMDLSTFTPLLAIRLFLIGMVAISAMFLPGISGSTMLLIFGAYMPIMNALHELMQFHFSTLPAILVFMLGLAAGAASVVRLIQIGLEYHRPQMVYFILGMMAASLYAIVLGPTTLEVPQAPLGLSNFNVYACALGIALVAGMQVYRMRMDLHEVSK